jgi:3-dehydroquinate synthase
LKKAGSLLNLNRKCLIVTGAMVPRAYSECIASQCREHVIVTVEPGENSKSFPIYERLCRTMLAHDFHRSDCVIAVGGGVIGDLAGFAAASYMRGIDFYNLPTTVLSQVDSSIGGKVAINLDGVKNIVGAFWQPRKVLIDPDTLKTLPQRQISNGLAEAVKMACTSDAALFSFMEEHDLMEHMDEIIIGSLKIKKSIVEQDETEQGLRKLLNFGHTIGHGIESTGALLHGECVALGMLPMCSEPVRARLIPVLKKAGLPTEAAYDREAVWEAMRHDKKSSGGTTDIVLVDEIGRGRIERVTAEALRRRFDRAYRED